MMELKIERTELARAMKIASRIVDKGSKVPLAASVLLRSDGASCPCIAAVGNDVTMSSPIACVAKGSGAAAINAAELARVAADAPGAEITIRVGDDGWTEVRSGKARYKIAHLNGRDYPTIPESAAKWTSVDAAVLVEALRRGASCPCTEGDRGWMMGALFDTDTTAGYLICASTDGKRLAYHRDVLPLPRVRKSLPVRWAEMVRTIAAGAEKVEISIETKVAGRVYIRTAGIVMSSPWLIADPDSSASMERFVSARRDIVIVADRERLVEAVKRVAPLASENSGITITTRGTAISLATKDSYGREIEDELECEVVGEITIGINARYLSECLALMTGDTVELRMSGPLDPVEARDSANTSFTGIVMPMRVN
jgi:DNA polymerase III subunit beta